VYAIILKQGPGAYSVSLFDDKGREVMPIGTFKGVQSAMESLSEFNGLVIYNEKG
jgi:hypothetical protein